MYKMLNRYFRFNKIIKVSLWKIKEFDKLQYSKKVLNVVIIAGTLFDNPNNRGWESERKIYQPICFSPLWIIKI